MGSFLSVYHGTAENSARQKHPKELSALPLWEPLHHAHRYTKKEIDPSYDLSAKFIQNHKKEPNLWVTVLVKRTTSAIFTAQGTIWDDSDQTQEARTKYLKNSKDKKDFFERGKCGIRDS